MAITVRDSGLVSLLISRGRYTSQCYHQAVCGLLIKCCYCFQLSSSVWSPQSIEFSLQQFCLPFLRLSCLLQHHLYGDNLTGCMVGYNISVILQANLSSTLFFYMYFCFRMSVGMSLKPSTCLCVVRRRMSSRPWLCVWGSYHRPPRLPTLCTAPRAWSGRSAPSTWWPSGVLRSRGSLRCRLSSQWCVNISQNISI